jgi:RNA polymerase sigma-70 factor (ECF subfamily)
LLVRVKAQDQAAWDRLVHLYVPLVYGWCRRAGLQEADARDVGQEVFKRVWLKIQGFRRERPEDSFRGWVRVIARNAITDFHRRRQAEPTPRGNALTVVEEASASALLDTDADMDRAEASQLYQRAVALIQEEFEEKTWRAFRAVVIEGQTPSEASRLLRMTVNAVYLAKARVLRRLRQEFEELIDP